MLNKIFSIAKRVIVAILLIYAYNKLAIPFDVIIPINIITICLVYIGGIPSILCLTLLFHYIV